MKYISFIASLVFASTAAAQQVEVCSLLGDLAEKIMVIRQGGMPPGLVLSTLVKDDNSETVNQIIVSLVKTAYAQPRYTTEIFQTRSVADFRSDAETTCLFE